MNEANQPQFTDSSDEISLAELWLKVKSVVAYLWGYKFLIVAVGLRVPDWAQTAWDDYAKRFPPELKVELKAVKTEPRGSKTLPNLYAAERQRIEAAIPRGTRIVVLDEGRVVQQGSHAELIKQPGSYAELYALQSQQIS